MKYIKPILLFGALKVFAIAIYFLLSSPIVISADKTVELFSHKGGACSGSYVVAPSGNTYILSAGHCSGLNELQGYPILHEDGSVTSVILRDLDLVNDLMLLETDKVGIDGIKVADSLRPGDKIYSYTHPLGNKLDLSLGVFDWYHMVNIGIISTMEGSTVLEGVTFGSSGGPVLNYLGQLVGIISAGDGESNFFVPLSTIKEFLSRH